MVYLYIYIVFSFVLFSAIMYQIWSEGDDISIGDIIMLLSMSFFPLVNLVLLYEFYKEYAGPTVSEFLDTTIVPGKKK